MGLQLLFAALLIIPVIGALVVVFLRGMLIVPLINVSILTTLYGVIHRKTRRSPDPRTHMYSLPFCRDKPLKRHD